MANSNLATTPKNQIKAYFSNENVAKKFNEILGKRSTSFITSVLQITSQNQMLSTSEPSSIYQAAMVAATLDLPLNQNLGFAYIIPFNDRKSGKVLAQFQLGYKGFIQLAQRSGQFKTISATAIYEGQLIKENPLTGFEFDFQNKQSDKVIGYAAYFSLLNGFEKTLYMSIDEMTAHGKRFSQTFKNDFGLWKDDFDSMAIKTVIKLLLSKYAPLSVDMQKAVITDQTVVEDAETLDTNYVDIPTESKEDERLKLLIEDCKSTKDLMKFKNDVPESLHDFFNEKLSELTDIEDNSKQ